MTDSQTEGTGRIIGYVRVSKTRGRKGDRFLSPKQQEERILQWAASHGFAVDGVLVELDRTGRNTDRPLLAEALRRVENGDVDRFVVAYLSRFGRSLVDGLAIVERIHDAGGQFVSVQDGFDLSTHTGRLVFRILMSVAEMESDRIGEQFDDARRDAVERGLHIASFAPPGYVQPKDEDGRISGPLEVDPTAGPVVAEAFRLRAAGTSWSQIGAYLRSAGLLTAHGNATWVPKTIRAMVRNRVYLGEARHGAYVLPGAHPALVDEVTFRRANQPGHKPPVRDLNGAPSVLQGLVRCGTCRYAMSTAFYVTPGGKATRRWACNGFRATGKCEAPASTSTRAGIEPYVVAAFLDRGRAVRAQRAPDRGATDLRPLRDAVDQARRAFEAFRDDPDIMDAIGDSRRYAEGLRVRERRLAEAEDSLGAAEERQLAVGEGPTAWAALVDVWDDLSFDHQQRLMRAAIQGVFIRPGRSRHDALSGKWIHIAWRDQPVEVPALGAAPGKARTRLPPIRFGG